MTLARLQFEFAPNARPANWIGRGLFAAVVAVCVWQGLQLAATLQEQHSQTRLLASLNAPSPAAGGSSSRPAKVDPGDASRMRAARLIERGLDTPWADLFESIEEAPHQAVALVSIDPSVAKQSLRLTAEARDAKEMLAFVSALQKDERLSAVTLASHQTQAQAPGTPVRFQVQAVWGHAP